MNKDEKYKIILHGIYYCTKIKYMFNRKKTLIRKFSNPKVSSISINQLTKSSAVLDKANMILEQKYSPVSKKHNRLKYKTCQHPVKAKMPFQIVKHGVNIKSRKL